MRTLERHPTGPKNSLQYWTSFVSPWRVAWNFAAIYLARFVPALSVKNALYRWRGMKVGRDVSVGLMAMFDVFFPEMITIGDNSVIGYNSTMLGHEFMVKEWRRGPIVIGRNVVIGANTTILPGVTIGDGAVVSAMSLVNRDIPAGAFAGGVPARVIGWLGENGELVKGETAQVAQGRPPKEGLTKGPVERA